MTTTQNAMSDRDPQEALETALRSCASEPIHLVGNIQSVGVMIAVGWDDFVIRVVSQNLDSLFPVSANNAIGRSLQDLLGGEQLSWLEDLRDKGPWEGAKIWSLSLCREGQQLKCDAQVFLSGALVVIEVEQVQPVAGDVFHELFIPIRDALWKLGSENDLGRYAQMTVDQVRLLTGFNRVMMYQFDSNWDGEVIAESKDAEVDSYLGNRFPASDIPPQARALYTRNLVRIIADVDSEQVPLIHGDDPGNRQPLDLSHSWLRSMSPVHVEYLRNMGVRASLSISLVQNNRLWGLIACHHFTPKYVNLRSRELDEFIGRAVSLKLINMDKDERDALNTRIRDLLYEMTELIRRSDDLDRVIHLLKDKLLGLVRAEGAIVTIDGARHVIGVAPPEAVMDRLLDVLRQHSVEPVFHTDDLGQLLGARDSLEPFAHDIAKGMLVAPLDHKLNNFVMWFRPGLLRTLRWAGNPEKTVIHDASGVRMSPRTSFETWIETYHDKSLPWSQVEVDAANSLSLALVEVLAQKALKSSEESYRLLAENSTDMIARLDLDGRFRFASPSCRELFGRECEQMIDLSLAEVVDEAPEVVQSVLADLQPLGAMVTRVIRGKRPDLGALWVEAALKHTLGTQGENEILLNARDVTQRYNYQLAIEDVHRRYTKILEAAGEGLVSIDTQGVIVYANEVAAKILGHYEDDLIGMPCCDAFDWACDDGACQQAHSAACPFLATLHDGETRQGLQQLPGSECHPPVLLNYVCTPLVENNSIAGCVIVFSEAIQQAGDGQNVAAEALLDQAIEAVMVTDAASCITSVNRAFTEITGYSADEAIGNSPRLLKSGVHTPHFYDGLWNQLKEKRRWSGEIWNRRKNGEIYPQWGSISAVLDNAGQVQNYVAVFSDISKAKQAEEKLYHLANHDTLTGLPNRMNFTEKLGQALERCRRKGCGLAVAFIDLDRFKIINDTLGHTIGDSYLKTVSERLLAATRKQDTLARWGGDEFILAMEDVVDRQAISDAMSRMLIQLAEPIYLAGHELVATASIGIAIYSGDGRKAADLIKAADTAMYRAKQHGRNCFEFYTQNMTAGLDTKLILASELRHALHGKQFFLVYQPQIDPRSGSIRGVEALVRWQHPVRGPQAPVTFLSMIEELGLMDELGSWVLEEACRQMKEWTESGLAIPRVAVNVTPSQLKESLVGLVAKTIEKTGIAPRQLEIEITEGALEFGDLARRITRGLRDLGVLLSVDDFGTGYSSLSHIKEFPITCFKIDKSFIDGVPGSENDVAIVRTILALGSIFKVEVVAEGAETAAQVGFLRAEGVTNIQGYFYAQPMTPDQVVAWAALKRDDATGT